MGEPVVPPGMAGDTPKSSAKAPPQAPWFGIVKLVPERGWEVLRYYPDHIVRTICWGISTRWEADLIAKSLEKDYSAHERMAEE